MIKIDKLVKGTQITHSQLMSLGAIVVRASTTLGHEIQACNIPQLAGTVVLSSDNKVSVFYASDDKVSVFYGDRFFEDSFVVVYRFSHPLVKFNRSNKPLWPNSLEYIQQLWVVDKRRDANGFWTIRIDDGSFSGDTSVEPIATVYHKQNANMIASAKALLLACYEFLEGNDYWQENDYLQSIKEKHDEAIKKMGEIMIKAFQMDD